MGIYGKLSRELSLAYMSILLFMMAQYVVNERPWDHILRIAGILAYMASMFLATRKQRLSS